MSNAVQVVVNHKWTCKRCGMKVDKKTYRAKGMCNSCYVITYRDRFKYRDQAKREHKEFLKYMNSETIIIVGESDNDAEHKPE